MPCNVRVRSQNRIHGDALDWRADMTIPPEPLSTGGMLRVPDTPGLEYELNETLVRSRLVGA